VKLFKYKSLDNLWHVLDIVVNQQLYCAHWSELNDPLEGRYLLSLGKRNQKLESTMTEKIEKARDAYRVASLTADPTNFLMWSHYASGHKGIVIEVDVDEREELYKVVYSPFSSVFTNKLRTKEDMRHLFNGKTPEWEYEQEYRVITESRHFPLTRPVGRILLGPLVDEVKIGLLRNILPEKVEIVSMKLDYREGRLAAIDPNHLVRPTVTPQPVT
jgi:hypothetical protein